jgi:peptide-methionine (R)-S-oxide reductase
MHNRRKNDAQWEKELSSLQYEVTRKKRTEAPFSGKYHHFKEEGIYCCVCCGQALFSSKDKYDSGTGWPSFSDAVSEEALVKKSDHSFLMQRTEVLCAACDAHLGHVFEDGPGPRGLRYCVNSASLTFQAKE